MRNPVLECKVCHNTDITSFTVFDFVCLNQPILRIEGKTLILGEGEVDRNETIGDTRVTCGFCGETFDLGDFDVKEEKGSTRCIQTTTNEK